MIELQNTIVCVNENRVSNSIYRVSYPNKGNIIRKNERKKKTSNLTRYLLILFAIHFLLKRLLLCFVKNECNILLQEFF